MTYDNPGGVTGDVVTETRINHEAIHRAVQALNEALEFDPVAINQLFAFRVIVNNQTLADHPTIQVWSAKETDSGQNELRMLGLINGLFGVDASGNSYIGVAIPRENEPFDRFLCLHCETVMEGPKDVGRGGQ